MLSHHNRLLFPRLRRLGACELVHPGDLHRSERGLFQLDWTSCDALKLDEHLKWARDQHPGKDLPFIPTLPHIIDETVTHQFFALNDAYLTTIRNHSQLAADLWGRQYSMDTMARGVAMHPVEALVWSALWLLADCAYDPENKYYIKTPTKIILPHAMAWKFWQHQTGRGLLWGKARMDDLDNRIKSIAEVSSGDGYLKGMLEDFERRMGEHQEELFESYGALCVDKDGAEGPCIVTPPLTPDVAPSAVRG